MRFWRRVVRPPAARSGGNLAAYPLTIVGPVRRLKIAGSVRWLKIAGSVR